MTDVLELINKVRGAGVILRAEPPDLIIRPADRVSRDLKARLRENKAEVLRRLELEASMKRLEAAGINIAIWETGEMRIVITQNETLTAIAEGGTIYSPEDMYACVTLTERERRMLHEFKRRFGGTTEWKQWSSRIHGTRIFDQHSANSWAEAICKKKGILKS